MLGLCESRAAWVAERRVGGEQRMRERKAGGAQREEGQKIWFVRKKELVRAHGQEGLCAYLSGVYAHCISERDDGFVEIARQEVLSAKLEYLKDKKKQDSL
mmetsp:Transcript_90560/g.132451  ORF Transcript_90560/g.132451 Transcript_90560/m.132451 type:complete len:101 (-) Transcript_90560:102-404(-)